MTHASTTPPPLVPTGEATALLPVQNGRLSPIQVIGTAPIRDRLDEVCLQQAINARSAPGVADLVLNPDAHRGYGAPVGCVLTIRLIGVIEAKQRDKGGSWIRNDRLLAVATHAHTHAHVQTLDDLRPRLLDEIEAFFETYNALKGKEFKPTDRSGPKKARKLLDEAADTFRKRSGQGAAAKAA